MRDKNNKIKRLEQEFTKYCEQIGIIDYERPKLCFTILEYVNNGATGRFGKRYKQTTLGQCFLYKRLILVRVGDFQYNRSIRNLIHTLVHELVHYRFPHLPHGLKFNQRIDEILKGKVYPFKSMERHIQK